MAIMTYYFLEEGEVGFTLITDIIMHSPQRGLALDPALA
jgi:hypothetical protein